MRALTSAGFVVPDGERQGSNLDQTRHYDQIAIYPHYRRFRGGVFDFYRTVVRS